MAAHLERITLAVEDMDAAVAFYDAVFGTELQEVGEGPFFRGTLAGIPLLLCPNSIAEVDARQNRHQLRIVLDDVHAAIRKVEPRGGRIVDHGEDDGRRVVAIADPEGNTYELIEE